MATRVMRPEFSYVFDKENNVLEVPYTYDHKRAKRFIPIRLLMSYTFRRLKTRTRVLILERLLKIETENLNEERSDSPPLFDDENVEDLPVDE